MRASCCGGSAAGPDRGWDHDIPWASGARMDPDLLVAAFEARAARVLAAADLLAACGPSPPLPQPHRVRRLRTAIRRLEAQMSVLPGRAARLRDVAAFRASCRRTLRRCGGVRDLDVAEKWAAGALGGCGGSGAGGGGGGAAQATASAAEPSPCRDSPSARAALDALRRRRAEAAALAVDAAERLLRRAPVPGLAASDVPAAASGLRLDGRAGRLVGCISGASRAAASGSLGISALHDLRKDCRRLRFLAELASEAAGGPRGGRARHGAAAADAADTAPPSIIPRLVRMQDGLGAVCDADVVAGCLQGLAAGLGGGGAAALAARAVRERKRLYDRLVEQIGGARGPAA